MAELRKAAVLENMSYSGGKTKPASKAIIEIKNGVQHRAKMTVMPNILSAPSRREDSELCLECRV